MIKKKHKRKNYFETVESLEWMRKNLTNHSESEFIRNAVKDKIEQEKRLIHK